MKIINQIFIFIYYVCVIVLTITLLSGIFNIVIGRLLTKSDSKTKYYYIELISVWVILIAVSSYIKYNISSYSKKTITTLVKKNGEEKNYNDLYVDFEQLEKFDVIIIVGFLVVFLNSGLHTMTEKMSLLNEDIGLFSDIFI